MACWPSAAVTPLCAVGVASIRSGWQRSLLALPIVVGEGIVHGVDALEIGGIEIVLNARAVARLAAEEIVQNAEDRVEDGDRRHLHVAAALFELLAKLLVHHRVEDDARVRLDELQDAL